jgi:hypothetical protein
MRGAKALSLTVPMFKVKFIDSLKIPMRLADFPKIFGIYELAKGYFPHLFNKKENESYVGPIPPSPYYNPNGMSPAAKQTFPHSKIVRFWFVRKRDVQWCIQEKSLQLSKF